jgi:hypothetical protein
MMVDHDRIRLFGLTVDAPSGIESGSSASLRSRER